MRATLAVLFMGMFYCYDWMPLRILLRDSVRGILLGLGYGALPLTVDGCPALSIGRVCHGYDPDCTYADLALVLLPFVWRVRHSAVRNISRFCGVVTVIAVTNLARTSAAALLQLHGWSIFWAHDVAAYSVWMALAVLFVALCIRSDSRGIAKLDLIPQSADVPR